MLTTSTRLKLQEICGRIARGESVSLQERVLLQKFAHRDRSVSTWVSRAHRQLHAQPTNAIDGLLADLDLGDHDPGDQHRPDDDLGDWFGQASPWLRRD